MEIESHPQTTPGSNRSVDNECHHNLFVFLMKSGIATIYYIFKYSTFTSDGDIIRP